jgi:hypothetical protein
VNLLTLPIVSGTIAGISFTLLVIVLLVGRGKKTDSRTKAPPALGNWEEHLPTGKV